jgi:hypothetical protein
MPTPREREYYRMGFADGFRSVGEEPEQEALVSRYERGVVPKNSRITKKRKLSAWNKFVKANSKKPRFRMRSGKLNLKKMGVAFRKTPGGRKKKGNRSY